MKQLQGKEVELEFDQGKTDQGDRGLVYVYKAGKDMFNEDLLTGGYA
jgi:endonuclease YncB( thermonuclease family)